MCLRVKPLTRFNADRRRVRGVRARCKVCTRRQGRKYLAMNRDKCRARHWVQQLKKYNITPAGYAALLATQGGRCPGCGATAGRKGQRLCVDHDHSSGAVRGLLCDGCNQALGHARDRPEVLRRLAHYLAGPKRPERRPRPGGSSPSAPKSACGS